MFKRIMESWWLKKHLQQKELSDKQYLIRFADTIDKAEFDDTDCMKMTKELAEQISFRLRKIGNRMVAK